MEHNINSEFKEPEGGPGFLLWKVTSAWRRSLEALLKAHDLTHSQFVVLAALGWMRTVQENVHQAEVASFTNMDPVTVSQIIRTLEKKEFIERVRLENNERNKYASITEKGGLTLSKAVPAVEAVDEKFFGPLGKNLKNFKLDLLKLTK